MPFSKGARCFGCSPPDTHGHPGSLCPLVLEDLDDNHAGEDTNFDAANIMQMKAKRHATVLWHFGSKDSGELSSLAVD